MNKLMVEAEKREKEAVGLLGQLLHLPPNCSHKGHERLIACIIGAAVLQATDAIVEGRRQGWKQAVEDATKELTQGKETGK